MKNVAKLIFNQAGLRLSQSQIKSLSLFEQTLVEWNSRFNLTAIRSEEEIRTKHFLDSLTCALAWRDAPPERLIDIGTGAGFPGLALKIAYPQMRVTLVESVKKKADFCRHIIQTLQLEHTEVLQDRAEALGQMRQHREQYDWAVARAVAAMPILAEYLLPLVKVGGHMLAMKGEHAPAETQSAEQALRILGGELRQLVPVALPGVVEERYLVVVLKRVATPPGYPRRVGLPARRPIGVPLVEKNTS